MLVSDNEAFLFELAKPNVQEVYLCGTFNGWSKWQNPMQQVEPGVWQLRIDLPHGEHEYRYFAVKNRLYSPSAPYGESQWLTDTTTLRVAADGLSEPRAVKNSAQSKIAI